MRRLVVLTAMFVLAAAPARAQHTSLSLKGGLSSGHSDVGAALGGTVTLDFSSWLAVEGEGTFLGRGAGERASTLGGALLVNLRRHGEGSRLIPYAVGGASWYRASFDMGHRRFAPMFNGQQVVPGATPQFGQGPYGPGMMTGPGSNYGPGWMYGQGASFGPGSMYGQGWTFGQMPMFYGRRLTAAMMPGIGADGRISGSVAFNDPAVSVGGGVRFETGRFSVRPDLRAVVVFADGETQTVGVFGLNVGYRF
jgi:hypothetical protein